MTDVALFLTTAKQEIEQQLTALVAQRAIPHHLQQSMLYSLEAGGKRIRPLLVLATIEAFQRDVRAGYKTAAALEMIHTYSLIHDDLPAMDDDDLRRGKPTNHIVFGEATAILAGDGLLTYSFEVIANDDHLTPETKVNVIAALANAAGPEGMVGGQMSDMEAEGKLVPIDDLQSIHERKTGKLLVFALKAGGMIAGATAEQLKQLEQLAFHLGIAFQIRDDILDIEGDEAVIGKPVGSDVGNDKSTYPALLSLAGAKEKLLHHIEAAEQLLADLSLPNDAVLQHLCQLIAARTH